MSLVICSECGHENQEDARYCDMCGIELPLPTSAEVILETEEIQSIAQEEEYAPILSSEISPEEEPEVLETPSSEIAEITSSQDEEELQPVAQIPEYEEEELQPVAQIPEYEEEEELQPIAQIPEYEEEEELQPVAQIPEYEEEEELQPVAQIPEYEEEEELQPVVQIPEYEEEEELQPVVQIPEPVPPISSATVLDWDEPKELIPEPSTALEVIEALLVHSETGISFDLPSGESLIYLGKINEEMPVQIDLSNLPNADIISRVHAVIHVEKEAFYIEDAGSLNKTALNGEELKPGARFRKPLKSGDTITLGRNKKINLTFEIRE